MSKLCQIKIKEAYKGYDELCNDEMECQSTSFLICSQVSQYYNKCKYDNLPIIKFNPLLQYILRNFLKTIIIKNQCITG